MTQILPKRALSNGRWDRELKKRMVALSKADNYEDAKHEWIATGNVWWDEVGDPENPPDFVTNHPYKCLCGHNIVYHFEIHNTETDVRECVGSDHINSYLILRAIREETGLTNEQITDEMIDEWVQVRVHALKKNAWWNVHGDHFIEMFEAVKDMDLRVNVRKDGYYYDSTLRMRRPKTFIRKRATGSFGDAGYKMASIVWRWNHPENPKAQINTRGFPNQSLWMDLMKFYLQLEQAEKVVQKELDFEKTRMDTLKKHDKKQADIKKAQIERREKMVSTIEDIQHEPAFIEACEYFGINPFIPEQGRDSWEENFLKDVKAKMIRGTILTDKQLAKLHSIFNEEKTIAEATEKQKNYLVKLGYEGDLDNLTKDEASNQITLLKTARWG
tara:strand:- start:37 stop:1197 length:1161 start_codon:yes stop_codon:yes gene_type:complete